VSACDGCSDRGQCCRYVELPVPYLYRIGETREAHLGRPLIDDEMLWLRLHPGLVMDGRDAVRFHAAVPWEWRGGSIRFKVPCSRLAKDGRCQVYGQPERPRMCSIWPDDPINQAPPGCVFLPMAVGIAG